MKPSRLVTSGGVRRHTVRGMRTIAKAAPREGVVAEYVGYHERIVHHDFSAYSGARIGVDPIMGDADYISCTLYVNGRVAWHDAAVAGDGTDANCILRLT